MKILVTGAGGFIGSYLVGFLQKKGCQVVAVSKSARKPGFVNLGDLDSGTDWSQVLNGCDTVIHLAGLAHRSESVASEQYVNANRGITLRLAEEAIKARVKKFIYISTVKVLGDRTNGLDVFSERSGFNPEDDYALSKVQAEVGLSELFERGTGVTIIRPPLVYGPGVKANFLALIKLVSTGYPLPLKGFNNKRSFIYIGNLVDILWRCVQTPATANRTFLVSDGDDLSTPELVELIARTLKVRPRLFYVPKPILFGLFSAIGRKSAFDRLASSMRIDCSLVREELSWVPPYSIEIGLKETIRAALGPN